MKYQQCIWTSYKSHKPAQRPDLRSCEAALQCLIV